jgi:hypothetical protein
VAKPLIFDSLVLEFSYHREIQEWSHLNRLT